MLRELGSVRRESVRLISSGKKDNNFIRSPSTKGSVDGDPLVFLLFYKILTPRPPEGGVW